MNKESYLAQIRTLLASLPEEDRERSLAFYAESIDDRMEDGMSEEQAVASMESPEEAARAILMDMPLPKLVKARVRNRPRLGVLEILLLALGAPLWLPLLLSILAILLSVYLVAWSLVLTLAAVVLALGLSALAVLVGSAALLTQLGLPGILLGPGAALILAGLAILTGFATVGAARLSIALGKAMLRGIKALLIHKEEAK